MHQTAIIHSQLLPMHLRQIDSSKKQHMLWDQQAALQENALKYTSSHQLRSPAGSGWGAAVTAGKKSPGESLSGGDSRAGASSLTLSLRCRNGASTDPNPSRSDTTNTQRETWGDQGAGLHSLNDPLHRERSVWYKLQRGESGHVISTQFILYSLKIDALKMHFCILNNIFIISVSVVLTLICVWVGMNLNSHPV